MKKLILLSAALIICTTLMAQPPQGISHQAVIRNTQGELVTAQTIGIRVSILQGSAEGTAVFVETHTPQSNQNGLITYVIGGGTNVSGSFEPIDWGDGPYFLKTEADPEGGTDYSISGTTQFLSVPYALHAQTSADAFDGDMKQGRIINLGDPVSAKDGATKEYVDVLLARIEALEALAGTTVTDIDGNVYRTVTIGAQVWMAENLRVTKYNNGDAIPTGLSNTEWANTMQEAYAVYFHASIIGLDSDEDVLEAYGALYNWHAVNNGSLCPIGWSVPSDADWTQLANYVVDQGFPNSDVANGAGNALKSCRQVNSPEGGNCDTSEHPRWNSQYTTHYGFDEFGFSALPGGARYSDGGFAYVGEYGYWWSATEYSDSGAWLRRIHSSFGDMDEQGSIKSFGFSVRCLRGTD